MKNLIFLLIVTLMICGCSQNRTSTKKQTTKKKSSTQSVIEGMTGHTAVKSGKKAANEVKKVSAAHEKDLEEILGK